MPKVDNLNASPLSGWNHIDALLDNGPGWNWLTPARNTLYYSYSVSSGTDPKSTGVVGTLDVFNATQQTAVVEIFRQLNQITGINFVEVADGNQADIHFANANIANVNFAGYTNWTYNYLSDSQQKITSYVAEAYVYIDNAESGSRYLSPTPGNYAFELLMHELGHAMGLKHSFSGAVVLPGFEDNTDNTLMSYTQRGVHSKYGPDDIAALSWIYGGDGIGGKLGIDSQGRYLIATPKDDTIVAVVGDDVLDGQAGNDVVQFSGLRSSYKLNVTGSSLQVTGSEGNDRLLNIERLKFSDMSVNLTVQAAASSIAASDLKSLEELYVAFFNRVPDADGLAYWISRFKDGIAVKQIAESFYNAGIAFSAQTGYSATMSNEAFINLVYKNVLGRSNGADSDGLAYWAKGLSSGAETHGSLVTNILASAHTFKGNAEFGWVADLLDNKTQVANQFAVKAGLNYNSDSTSILMGMDIAAKVTPTSIDNAIKLIGLSPDQFNLG